VSTPSELYRNAIDLNRYSNSVARGIVGTYNDIIIDAVNQIDNLLPNVTNDQLPELRAPDTLNRLRSVLAQIQESLETWSFEAAEELIAELQGLAELQSEFAQAQLKRALPRGAREILRSVAVSPQFARSVVLSDPTQLNVVTLSDDIYGAVLGSSQKYNLTATQGSLITLPNGKIVSKAFRGLAEDQAERFARAIRAGLVSGEPTPKFTRRLIGRLRFGDKGPLTTGQARAADLSLLETYQAGGDLTRMANRQIATLVRTTVNEISNAASQQVYKANEDITKKYRYLATLDSKTSAICRALDGREFEYGDGPEPPQHFGCRSTTVPVIDYEELGFDPPPKGKRAAKGGMVPADISYGEWLYEDGSRDAHERQEDALGPEKAAYFRRLARKHGPKAAIAKLVRDDGSELTLADLRRRYGKID
jgi:SPP1 gp7 family putative phage head morphogenesis protein